MFNTLYQLPKLPIFFSNDNAHTSKNIRTCACIKIHFYPPNCWTILRLKVVCSWTTLHNNLLCIHIVVDHRHMKAIKSTLQILIRDGEYLTIS